MGNGWRDPVLCDIRKGNALTGAEQEIGKKGMAMIQSVNPATGEVLRTFEPHAEREIEARLRRAVEVYEAYRRIPFSVRGRMLGRVAEILEAEKLQLARTMTLEMGKPLRAAVQEAEKCAVACRYYVENGERFLREEEVSSGAERSWVRYQPLGPVLAVMPWNFPFWQVFRFAAPALMAGNVGLLKHASNVPQCALAIEDVFRRAGFPEGVFQVLLVDSGRMAAIIADRRVAAVTLTGSVAAGSSVAALAGKHIKKTVLELGGSDPFIAMPSADLERAVAIAAQARTINNGQSCIAAKRFIVHRRIAEEFTRRFVARMASLRVGDPLDEATDVGPLATSEVLGSLAEQVELTLRLGARLLLGGGKLERPGFFYAPTVLADIPPGSPAHADELFGPVASIFAAESMEDAVRMANDTPFGLGASAWTNDPGERELFIEGIEAGMAFINGMVASDPRLPFGGIKMSGYGRELSSQGIREFTNIKTVAIYEPRDAAGSTPPPLSAAE
jgi:succinate-semialdehyde dehydrogenase/glutarate-semialdehyde dehydrogenase